MRLGIIENLPNFSVHRTYEMELQLDDPKSKEDDPGLILIDLCLMFRDATIKKGPVCVCFWLEIFANVVCLHCINSCFVFIEMGSKKE